VRLFGIMVSTNHVYLFFLLIFIFFCSLLSFVEGPGAMASKICMDKVATSVALKHVRDPNLNMNIFSVEDKEHSSYISFLNFLLHYYNLEFLLL